MCRPRRPPMSMHGRRSSGWPARGRGPWASAGSCASRSTAATRTGARSGSTSSATSARSGRGRRPRPCSRSRAGQDFRPPPTGRRACSCWRPVSARRDLLLVDLRGTGPLGRAQLPGVSAPHPAVRRPRRPAARPRSGRARRLRHLAVGAGPRGGRRRARHPPPRRVRRLVRLVRRAGVRDPLSAPAALARPGRHLPAARVRPGAGRPRPEHAELAAAGVRAPPGLPAPAAIRWPCSAGSCGTSATTRSWARHPTPTGRRTHVRADPDTLGQLVQSGFYYQGVWRDIFAATRSAFAGDTRPLLRLVAETETTDGPNGDPREFTESLYLSVICHDYPELWPMGTPVSQRAPFIRSRARRLPAGDVRAVHRQGVDRARLRGRARVPELAAGRVPRPAGLAVGAVPARADADPERRPRQHHPARRRPRRRVAVPRQHARGHAEQRPRHRAPRPERLRGADLRALRARPAARATRRAPHRIARGAGGAVVPAHARRDGARALLAGRPVHPERPPHRRGERVRGRRRAAAMVGEPERQRASACAAAAGRTRGAT